MSERETLFRVILRDGNKDEYSLYAREFYRSDIYGFVELEEFVFEEGDNIIVNPVQEKLKTDLAGVRRTFIPFASIVRIDEVESREVRRAKAAETAGKVAYFPGGNKKSPGGD